MSSASATSPPTSRDIADMVALADLVAQKIQQLAHGGPRRPPDTSKGAASATDDEQRRSLERR